MRFNIFEILLVSCLISAAGGTFADAKDPLFTNSIVSTEIDFITSADPSAFTSLRFLGRDTKEMPDKRSDKLFSDDVFIFESSFTDGNKVQIWAHRSFESMELAKRYADMTSEPLGKLPEVMREKLSHVVIHKGDQTAFAESEANFFVLYSENMETRIFNKDLEETVFHESVHATLDARYLKSAQWVSAQIADGIFITAYAQSNPAKEDMAESALFAYTTMMHPNRLSNDIDQWVRENMPNRLDFFRTVFSAPE